MPTGLELRMDEITNQLQFTADNVKATVTQCKNKLNADLRTIAIKAWWRGQTEWADYTKYEEPRIVNGMPCMNWGDEKVARGFSRAKLIYKGRLGTDLAKASYDSINVKRVGKHGVSVEIDLSRQFIKSYYIAYHELGTKKMPSRPIFMDKKTVNEFDMAVQQLGSPALIAKKALEGKEPEFKAPVWTKKKPQIARFPSLFFMLPLGTLFKYMGLYSDIYAIWEGSILQKEAFEAYMRHYFIGRAGFPTPKKARRLARRMIWR